MRLKVYERQFFFWQGSIIFHFWSIGKGFFFSPSWFFLSFSVKLFWVFGIRDFFLFMDLLWIF